MECLVVLLFSSPPPNLFLSFKTNPNNQTKPEQSNNKIFLTPQSWDIYPSSFLSPPNHLKEWPLLLVTTASHPAHSTHYKQTVTKMASTKVTQGPVAANLISYSSLFIFLFTVVKYLIFFVFDFFCETTLKTF